MRFSVLFIVFLYTLPIAAQPASYRVENSLVYCRIDSVNRIQNGGFEDGNTGFTSGLPYRPCNATNNTCNGAMCANSYTITNSLASCNGAWTHEFGDGLLGNANGVGNAMLIRLDSTNNTTLWQQRVHLDIGYYDFKYRLANLDIDNQGAANFNTVRWRLTYPNGQPYKNLSTLQLSTSIEKNWEGYTQWIKVYQAGDYDLKLQQTGLASGDGLLDGLQLYKIDSLRNTFDNDTSINIRFCRGNEPAEYCFDYAHLNHHYDINSIINIAIDGDIKTASWYLDTIQKKVCVTTLHRPRIWPIGSFIDTRFALLIVFNGTDGICGGVAQFSIFITEDIQPLLNLSGTNCQIPTTISMTESFETYHWSTGETTPTIIATSPAIYTVTVTCGSITSSSSVQVGAPPNALQIAGDSLVCAGHQAILLADAVYTNYQWSNGAQSQQIQVSSGGNYCLTATNPNGCQARACHIVKDWEASIGHITPTHPTLCPDVNARIRLYLTDTTNELRYSWNAPPYTYTEANAPVFRPDTYTVTVSEAHGCSTTRSVTVSRYPPIDFAVDSLTANCEGQHGALKVDSILGGAGAPYTAAIDGGTQQVIFVFPTNSGNHSLLVEDVAGCLFSKTASVPSLRPPLITIEASSEAAVLGDSVLLAIHTIQGNTAHYQWLSNPAILCDTCQNTLAILTTTNKYSVVATDSNGCTATATISIEIKDATAIYLPNTITPNGDGNNDYFAVFGGVNVKTVKLLRIFDRYGELVYEKHDFAPNTPTWDGTWARYATVYVAPAWGGQGGVGFGFSKTDAAIDVYAVYTEVELIDGTIKVFVQDFTVVR
jgi:gliding motility-associated-like protein